MDELVSASEFSIKAKISKSRINRMLVKQDNKPANIYLYDSSFAVETLTSSRYVYYTGVNCFNFGHTKV